MSIKKLDALRDLIATLADQRDEVESAPIPRAEAAANIAAMIDAPYSETLINGRIDLDPLPGGLLNGNFGSFGLSELLDRPGILRAVFPNALQEYLIGRYDAQLGDAKPGLPAIERRKRLTTLDAQIYALETQEEALIESLEDQGVDVVRRPDANPAAALGLPSKAA